MGGWRRNHPYGRAPGAKVWEDSEERLSLLLPLAPNKMGSCPGSQAQRGPVLVFLGYSGQESEKPWTSYLSDVQAFFWDRVWMPKLIPVPVWTFALSLSWQHTIVHFEARGVARGQLSGRIWIAWMYGLGFPQVCLSGCLWCWMELGDGERVGSAQGRALCVSPFVSVELWECKNIEFVLDFLVIKKTELLKTEDRIYCFIYPFIHF